MVAGKNMRNTACAFQSQFNGSMEGVQHPRRFSACLGQTTHSHRPHRAGRQMQARVTPVGSGISPEPHAYENTPAPLPREVPGMYIISRRAHSPFQILPRHLFPTHFVQPRVDQRPSQGVANKRREDLLHETGWDPTLRS